MPGVRRRRRQGDLLETHSAGAVLITGPQTTLPRLMLSKRLMGDGSTLTSVHWAESLPEPLRWKGEGHPPASWWTGGTKVYRSYEDYCDD